MKRLNLHRLSKELSATRGSADFAIVNNIEEAPANNGQEQASVVNSIEEFEQLVEEGKANIATAWSFLERSQAKLSDLPLEKQREEAAKVGAGRVLSWLWRCREEDTRMVDLDRYFTLALCWHLAAEGKDDFIWSWLEVEAANEEDRSPETQWNGRLLAGLVAARLYWERSADGAISLYLRAAKDFRNRVHLVQAKICITKAICAERSSRRAVACSPSQFERFSDSLQLTNSGQRLAQERAYLAMSHPTHPDATPTLDYCQRRHDSPDDFPTIKREAAQKSHAMLMARASYILRLQ